MITLDLNTMDRLFDFTEAVLDKFGDKAQCMIAAEELNELQKELFKHVRGKTRREAIVEEMADVFICLHELQAIFDIDSYEIRSAINKKLDREDTRLGL